METLVQTSIVVGLSLVLSAAVFVGANRLIDRIKTGWPIALAGLGALLGAVLGAVLQHNGVLKLGGDVPLYAIGHGWLTILVGAAIGAALGYAIGSAREPSLERRTRLEERWRPVAFVGPAVFFIGMGLVVPSIRTMLLSFREGRRGEGGFSLVQYRQTFGDESFFNLDGLGDIFTSRLMVVGVFAVAFAAAAAWLSTRKTVGGHVTRRAEGLDRVLLGIVGGLVVLAVIGLVEAIIREPNRSWIYDEILTPLVSSPITLTVSLLALVGLAVVWAASRNAGGHREPLDWGAPISSTSLLLAVILVLFAVFSTLESTLWNNLWWVAVVTGMSVTFGLLLAVLADRSRGEKTARTLIFLPMAISMVGAAVIWDFMYETVLTGDQTGLINAVLQGLGFEPRGFFINSSMIPWNNFWIMLILVWIQTGFAMVILSSAIKGVPEDMIEAARVDGATEVDVFWRIIIPSISSTIIVVTTTLIITVMKVFDLVKATTGGANRTDVIANTMFNQLRDFNFSLASALAVIIFALTVPVMIVNIRRAAREVA